MKACIGNAMKHSAPAFVLLVGFLVVSAFLCPQPDVNQV